MKGIKKKRKPSAYNLFIKKCMGQHREELKGKQFGAAAPIMKECVEQWKALNEENKQSFQNLVKSCRYNEKENFWNCEPEHLNEEE